MIGTIGGLEYSTPQDFLWVRTSVRPNSNILIAGNNAPGALATDVLLKLTLEPTATLKNIVYQSNIQFNEEISFRFEDSPLAETAIPSIDSAIQRVQDIKIPTLSFRVLELVCRTNVSFGSLIFIAEIVPNGFYKNIS